jgi:hypothetical protein
VFGLARGLAHGQDGRGGGHRVGDADEGLLGDVRPFRLRHGENEGPEEGEAQTDPVGIGAVRIKAHDEGHDGPQGGDLGQGEIHEDHPPLHHMHTEIRVDAREDQACREGRQQKQKDVHGGSLPFRESA